MRIINTELIASPYNWLAVFLMAAFGFFLLALVNKQDF